MMIPSANRGGGGGAVPQTAPVPVSKSSLPIFEARKETQPVTEGEEDEEVLVLHAPPPSPQPPLPFLLPPPPNRNFLISEENSVFRPLHQIFEEEQIRSRAPNPGSPPPLERLPPHHPLLAAAHLDSLNRQQRQFQSLANNRRALNALDPRYAQVPQYFSGRPRSGPQISANARAAAAAVAGLLPPIPPPPPPPPLRRQTSSASRSRMQPPRAGSTTNDSTKFFPGFPAEMFAENKGKMIGSLSVELAESSCSHLFRHASEITRETKGGYLMGRIKVPEFLAKGGSGYIRLCLAPSEVDEENNAFHLHPNLLHINMRTNKKTRKVPDGELPDDVDWNFVFKVQEGEVYRVCPPVNPQFRKRRFHMNKQALDEAEDRFAHLTETEWKKAYCKKLLMFKGRLESLHLGPLRIPHEHHLQRVTSLKEGYIEMGSAGLMLNVITPLQKFSKGGTTISDVLRQRFEDLFHRTISSHTLTQVENVYTGKKEDRIKLQQVTILAELFDDSRERPFATSALSDIVTNSKSKECGPLQLHDINPSFGCCQNETKVFILSFFKLVHDVKANFILFDPVQKEVTTQSHHELFSRIKRPKDCSVFNQTVLICTVPEQDPDVIADIEKAGLELRITAYRPSDNKMSKTSFLFRYLSHNSYVRRDMNHRRGRIYGDEDDEGYNYDDEEDYDEDDDDGGYGMHGRRAGTAAAAESSRCACCQLMGKNSRRDGVQELPVAKPGVQRRIANLTEAPKECSSSEVMSAASRNSFRRSSDLEEGIMMHNGADFTVGSLEEGNIPTFLMDQLGPSTTTTTTPQIPHVPQVPQVEPQVKMNFTITSNDIVEMKIEPDVILADASDEKMQKKRPFPERDFKMRLDKQRTTEVSPKNHCVPPKKRRHDLIAEGNDDSGSGGNSPKDIKEEPTDETDHEGHLTIPVPPIMQHSSSSRAPNNLQRSNRLDMLLNKTGGHVAAADLSKLSRFPSSSTSPSSSDQGLGGSCVTRPVLLKPRKDLGPNER